MSEIELPLVAVIVLNWNNFRDTAKCVDSVKRSDYRALVPIIVDNASSDGSFDALARDFPGVHFVRNLSNLGFAAGCNSGVRYALEHTDCSYVIIANNDCRLSSASVSAAVREAEADPAIGVVAAKIIFSEESRKVWHAGGTISKWKGQSRARGFGELDSGQYDLAEDTEWASGALMMIRREVLESVGLLCEDYFFGVEEWDFSVTVRAHGWRIRYCPAFVGYHGGDGSHGNAEPRYVYNYYRNKLIFQQKHLAPAAFRIWHFTFRLYVRYFLKSKTRRLANRYGYFAGEKWLDEIQFAAETAMRDHGTNRLSEHTLAAFSAILQARRHTQTTGQR